MLSVLDRFLSKVEKTDGCWLWKGASDPKGYGHMSIRREGGGKKFVRVHRFSYESYVGPIPDGLELDHLCRVRNCVNPLHLEPVTTQVNTLRGETIAAQNLCKTHCKHGHEFTPENTILIKRTPPGRPPWRQCRTCYRTIDAARVPRRRSK